MYAAAENEGTSVPAKPPNYSDSFRSTKTEMLINFAVKVFLRFFEAVFAPEAGFCPTVSAVIEQSIRGDFNRILHGTGYQMLPGFAHCV